MINLTGREVTTDSNRNKNYHTRKDQLFIFFSNSR